MKNFGDNIVYRLGIVEDINDPLKLGRARVRLVGVYDDLVPVEHLPWAICVYPITGFRLISPPAIKSYVLCWIVDEGMQQIIIVGELPGIVDGKYPDTPDLARNGDDIGDSIIKTKEEGLLEGDINEPSPADTYATLYPKNKVINVGKHYIELDDTPGFERIHIYHESGSYIEMTSEGNITIKGIGDVYDINTGTKYESVGGMKQSVMGSEYKIKSPLVTIEGTLFVSTGASSSFTADGKTITVAGGVITNIA